MRTEAPVVSLIGRERCVVSPWNTRLFVQGHLHAAAAIFDDAIRRHQCQTVAAHRLIYQQAEYSRISVNPNPSGRLRDLSALHNTASDETRPTNLACDRFSLSFGCGYPISRCSGSTSIFAFARSVIIIYFRSAADLPGGITISRIRRARCPSVCLPAAQPHVYNPRKSPKIVNEIAGEGAADQ